MRVITGEARGRRLKELSGMDTRPTTDKVKESMFNIVQFDIEGRKVLDLFAGTGQLGIDKQVDDILFDLYGEENPHSLADYENNPGQNMNMGGM